MSADKRSFVEFESMPGGINEDTNRYEFPTLYKTASTGKPRQWTMYCRLIKLDSKNQSETKAQNWNMLIENEVPILEKYIPNLAKVPDGTIAEIWSEAGVMGMKISRSPATYIMGPKNLGRKDERNVLQQAMVTIRGKYLKKIDEGSVTELTNLLKDVVISSNTKFYPMLAKKYDDFIDKIKYPVYVQPKLDGNRCVVFLNTIDNPTYKNVIMYTRSLKEYPNNPSNDAIRKALLDLLIANYHKSKNESIFLDGELYIHNKSLQDINSEVRGQALNGESMQYWIYDHFYPSYTSETFKERDEFLNKIYDEFLKKNTKGLEKNTGLEIIKLLEVNIIESEEECDEIYNTYLADNYEGIMIRNPAGIYQKSSTKKSEQLRSKDLLKRKETYDDEFEVVGYTQGSNGKEIGAVVWICKANTTNTTKGSNTTKSDTFNVTPNLSIKERYEIYKECEKKFDSKYKGRLLTVQYRGLSDNNIPLQAKAIEFRDIK